VKVLLVNPFYPLSELPSPPLGIGYLAASLLRAGHEVRVYDLVVMRHDRKKLGAIMKRFQPDLVGATSVTMTFDSALAVVRDAKSIDPDVVTVLGGAHVSFCAERSLHEHPEVDVIVVGEGEDSVLELCDAVAGKRRMHSVAGLCFRGANGLVHTGPRSTYLDVNTLPLPARELGPVQRYRALGTPISMTTSRGCPFSCIFCVGRKLVGKKVRYRSAHSVVDELEQLAQLGFAQINIADDLFTAKKSHAYAVCDEIIRRGLSVRWVSFANVNTVDVPLLTRMREAGCTTVSFGFESADLDILKTVKKGIRPAGMLAAVHACREAGVLATGSFIVGLPGETADTLARTQAFADELAELGAQCGFHMLAPFPGTAVREQAEQYQLQIFTDDWSQYHANFPITQTPGAPRELQARLARRFQEGGERAFWELAQAVEEGRASAEQREHLAQLERVGVYYDMMLQDILEQRGSFRTAQAEVSPEQAVELLAREVHAVTGRALGGISEAIVYGVEHRFLTYSSGGGVCRFGFAGSSAALSVTDAVRAEPLVVAE
jgi:anaerobic magnesium-protoporphyrin IX monomethyl ester cyclase